MSASPALRRVGEAAIAARMTAAQLAADPAAAMTVAQDAMRATLGLVAPTTAAACMLCHRDASIERAPFSTPAVPICAACGIRARAIHEAIALFDNLPF